MIRHSAVRENDQGSVGSVPLPKTVPGCSLASARSIGGIESHDDVTVTGQILGERRVVPHSREAPALIITTGYDRCCGDRSGLRRLCLWTFDRSRVRK